MYMNKKSLILFALASLSLSGCAAAGAHLSASEPSARAETGGEPVTLQVFQAGGSISDTEFKQLIADPVRKKYPHITLELIRESANTKRDQLITSGSFPDLIFTSSISMGGFLDLELMKDLQEPIKKSNLDLNRFEPRSINGIKAYGSSGQVYALPFSINFGALYYNKDLFDRVGEPYPQDGITWEEALDIGKKLAAKDNTMKALGTSGVTRDYISLLLPVVDAKTDRAALATDDWRWLLQFHESLSKIPDNRSAKGGRDGFVKDKTMAMYTSYGARIGELEEIEQSGQGFNWDLTTFPVRKDASVQGMETESHVMAVSATAKHPDTAFEVIRFLTTSDEVQMQVAGMARISSLKDDKYKKEFGANLKSLNGKNVQAIFKNKYGTGPLPTKYDAVAEKAVSAASQKVNKGEADINSALRAAEEAANKEIDSLKAGEQARK
ncbi:ABC transporter substrate-binding protein [Paenibacillus allorhizosphaerae]|uniref:Extracellular solute-binding protein n=1 Tax=Paenibacillus allorhizosphaerae TaxID=2849866 RepID=A0ABN7TUJ5_9BACL|nr:extracellular solute-binding protein [Paenibacillus allorhizosphaerae]CAG7652146.1 hypothetical protein PAECIP111802_05148 [Paenibacillus allorhizosphaerae]